MTQGPYKQHEQGFTIHKRKDTSTTPFGSTINIHNESVRLLACPAWITELCGCWNHPCELLRAAGSRCRTYSLASPCYPCPWARTAGHRTTNGIRSFRTRDGIHCPSWTSRTRGTQTTTSRVMQPGGVAKRPLGTSNFYPRHAVVPGLATDLDKNICHDGYVGGGTKSVRVGAGGGDYVQVLENLQLCDKPSVTCSCCSVSLGPATHPISGSTRRLSRRLNRVNIDNAQLYTWASQALIILGVYVKPYLIARVAFRPRTQVLMDHHD